ncbi:FAD-binding oxidoreductase [Roseateles puraquae]|uniref:D-lactate dehydrogenase (cytochrome) n=1 Tax=Roseateles puraquae TaxID=431059 RepID=A0A254N6D3_9BURK|nr:FAD-linked oxidase C-terminal domain-containing protein [Roseateles puraquae]MDG0856823.1 FAD-binding protein [Roseateles puraquae]OWR01927.1 2-hydroxy-acid oxidase [Roseateles puraquae]
MNAPAALDAVAPPLPAGLLSTLQAEFGARCSTALAVRQQHGRDESVFDVPPPQAVVFVDTEAEVARVVSLCAAHRVPVIPYGAGSSLEGHLLAVQGGISLDVSRMDRVLRIDAEDLTVTVQPGVTRKQLNEALKHEGLFFPIDPGADASLGGMAATRASGTNAVRYGTMRENVLGLRFVNVNGEIVRTGSRAKKSSAGYDLTRLLIGSEGTLGVITELTVKVHPLPEAVSAAVCFFPSIDAAVRTAMQVIQIGIPIARCELLDTNAIRAVNAHDKLGLKESPMLLMEFHGSEAGVAEQAAVVQDVAAGHGGEAFEWATTPEARTRLWTARHHAYLSGLQMRPGCRAVTTDTCVPISRLAENINASIAEVEAAGLPYFIVGHVGDGNFHLAYLLDPTQPEELATAERLSAQMVARAIAMEGTCTGEHGIGLHKQGFLVEETGDEAVAMMRAVKAAMDPLGILNPGKIFR